MSSRIFRMWPALALALLVAAVWHWGLPSELAQAQGSPVLELGADTLTSDNVVVEGDTLTVSARGYDPDERIWLYLWTRGDAVTSFPACLDVAEDVNLVSEGRLDSDGSASFSIEVSVPPLAVGDNNLLCAVRRGGQYATARLTVEVPPETYRMQLELTAISAAGTDAKNTLIADNVLDGDFEVRGVRGLTEWGGTQRRGVDADDDGDIEGDELLVQVEGEWRACPKRGSLNVGCEWDDLNQTSALLETRSGSHLVPGNGMVLRLSLPDTGGGGDLNLAAERFVVFWGPVDVWLLGTHRTAGDGGVAAEDFVVHDEHLRPLASELNSKIVQLRPGDEVELEISRNSSNAQGHTFVSMVPCNDNYLKRLFGTEATAGEVAQQLRGLEDCTVQQGPAFEDYGNDLAPNASYLVRSGEHWLREAWVQHDVLSGHGLHCSITPTVYSDWVEIEGTETGYWVDTWSLDVSCFNGVAPDSEPAGTGTADCYTALTKEYDWASSPRIDVDSGDVMRKRPVPPTPATDTTPGDPGSPAVSGVDRRSTTRYWCGWEPEYFKDATNGPAPRGYHLPWYNTRYNAANGFYSFAFEWELGGGSPANAYGCGAMLLPDINGTGIAIYPDASRWRVIPPVHSDGCEAGPDDDAISVGLYAPRPPALNLSRFSTMPEPAKALAEYRARRAYELVWGRYPDHSMHFAVYLSGMPSVFDYRSEESAVDGDSEGTGANAEWRLVSLGSWSYDERGEVRSGSDGGRALLGVAHPVGGVSATDNGSSALDAVPAVREMYGGRSLTVTRDYANRDGYVDVYVVPCRPLHSASVPVVDEVQGACEHLPPGNGQVLGATFNGSDSIDGPFGLREPRAGERDYTLDYSFKFSLRFRGSAWRDEEERRVSLPRETPDAPSGDCEVHSALTGGALYWPEVVVQGGACDSGTLSTVRVRVVNDGRHDLAAGDARPESGGRTDRLMVYVTGGRSTGLDQVSINRAARTYDDAEPLGRLGVRERRLVLEYDGNGTIHVNPDLANRDGDVWLLFYSCGVDRLHGAVGHCPLARRHFRDVPIYDVPVPPSFVVRVHFTAESGLAHTDFGPICQGDDCDPRVPVLRDALPDGGASSCEVSSYPAGVAGLVYWPDRLVQGGACAPPGLSPVSVSVKNGSAVGGQNLVVYATGGRTPGLEEVQVMRGGGVNDDGEPSGKIGLREVRMSLDVDGPGNSGSVLVDPDLADEEGRVWLLAYLCSGAGSACPSATETGNSSLYAVDRRPLFQVLVQYDADLLAFSSLSICRGDSCAESYPLGRLSVPDGPGCSVEAQHDQERLYWPDALVTGGDCERRDLRDVPVSFALPEGVADENLLVYVTGGRSRGLEEVSVLRAADQAASTAATAYVGHLVDEPVLSLVDAGSTVPAVVASKSWVTDGLTEREREAISWLRTLESNVDRVGRMPFLNDFDELDYLTLRALSRANRLGVISDILGHAALSSGIGNADRVKVIGVSTMVHGDTATSDEVANIRSRLASSSTYGAPPVSREDFSVIVATASGERRDHVANEVLDSLLEIKRLMERDFPTDHVLLFLDEASVPPSPSDGFRIKGVNFGYAMSYLPDLSTAELSSGIAHEVSHYYWRGADQRWLHEGIASAFEVLVGGDERREKSEGCTNLRKLVEASLGLGSALDICNYYLGQRLFLDLHRSLGDDDFYGGLQRLYDRVEACQGPPKAARCGTIDDVRAAFPDSLAVIDQHWGLSDDVGPSGPADASGPLGRLGLRERQLTLSAGQTASVLVSPDLADQDGNVWLFAYRCVGVHGDRGCPLVNRPAFNGYDLPVGPTFAVRVKFTEESGLTHTTLGPVCQGNDCSPTVPVLREASPADDVGVGVCGASSYLGGGGRVYWPDRVIQGGACDRDDLGDAPVSINNVSVGDGQRLVLYANGGRSGGLGLVRTRRGEESADAAGVAFGRMGLRRIDLNLGPGESKTVSVSPDLAAQGGNVWLLAYLCDDGSCPAATSGGDLETYAVDRRPLFQLRVRFTPESGLQAASLSEVCQGQDCDIPHPWLRRAGPTGSPCNIGLGAYWPDRVISGGSCWFRGTRYGTVSFENVTSADEKFVVYSTGHASGDFGALPVYGMLRGDGDAGDDSGVQMGRVGLRENLLTASAGGSAEVYFRSEMAGDDGEVWLFVYRCLSSHGDAGCPLVGRDAVRPEYDIGIRPTFVVRAGFVNSADADRSTLDIDCSAGDSCVLTAVFRDTEGKTLPGTAEFRVDGGALGAVGSTAVVSRVGYVQSGEGFEFVETLHLPVGGGIVNVTVELLGDGATLRGRAGRAASIASLSVSVMRCSDDEASCHSESLESATSLNRGDRFVFVVSGLDAAGDVGLDAGLQAEQRCTDGIVGAWPVVRLSTTGLRSYPYGTGQLQDRGYAGCAYRVTDDADFGSHGYTVTYSSGGATLSASGAVTVVRSAADLSLLGLTGPAQIESGSSATFHVVGYNAAGLPVNLTGGCVAVDVSGELTGDDDCATTGLPSTGFALEVTANAGVVLRTDSSVGVSYQGLSVRRHVLVVPAGDDGGGSATPPVSSGDSGINGLTITPDGSQLRLNWTSTLNADFASLRAQVWVRVGDEDVFLPGCLGGEVHDVSTVEVFCMLSHGQSGDVYHAAVGFIRGDRTAAPVETVQWTRP